MISLPQNLLHAAQQNPQSVVQRCDVYLTIIIPYNNRCHRFRAPVNSKSANCVRTMYAGCRVVEQRFGSPEITAELGACLLALLSKDENRPRRAFPNDILAVPALEYGMPWQRDITPFEEGECVLQYDIGSMLNEFDVWEELTNCDDAFAWPGKSFYQVLLFPSIQ